MDFKIVFKNKELRTALLISLLWHFIWFSLVSITLIPEYIRPAKFSTVSFIGSILSDTAFDPKFGLSSIGMRNSLSSFDKRRDGFKLEVWSTLQSISPEERIPKEIIGPLADKKVLTTLDEIFPSSKEVPETLSKSNFFDKTLMVFNDDSSSKYQSEGREQIPLYKPPIPEYSDILKRISDCSLLPSWEEEELYSLNLAFKLLISPEGKVEFAERTISSGHPLIDNIGMRYIMNWQFAPLNQQTSQWRTVKLGLGPK